MSMHTDLIDAVNEAKTEAEHRDAQQRLQGFREGRADAGRPVNLMAGDIHTMERLGEDPAKDGRPMCCGVLLDWKPADHG